MEDIEIILVNDASTDDSYCIMKKYEKQFPEKIKLINSKINLRQGGARNLGLQVAKGDYISFVDSDDVVHPHMYEKLYKQTLVNDCDYVICGYKRIKAEDKYSSMDFNEFTKMHWDTAINDLSDKYFDNNDRKKLIVLETGGVWTKLYKKSFLINNALIFPEKLKYEDNYWATIIATCTNKIIVLDEILYYYRSNPNSTVNIKNRSHMDRLKIEEMIFEKMRQIGLLNTYYSEIEYNFAYRYYNNSFKTFYYCIHPFPWDEIKNMKRFIKMNFPNIMKNDYLINNRQQYRFFILAYVFSRPTYIFFNTKKVLVNIKSVIKKFFQLHEKLAEKAKI
jgi:glycosyltransferase involved in cell wall biosynthesis